VCERCGTCSDECYAEVRQIVGREMTVEQVMAEIAPDTAFYDESHGGVTFSGGEPLLQRDFLQALLQACQARELHTAVDTSGFASWDTIDQIRPFTDLFLYDLKLIDDEQHREFTGVTNQPILRNLQELSALGHSIVIRIPIVPGLNDDDDSIWQMAEFIAALPHRHPIDLLPYHHIAVDKYLRLGKPYRLFEVRRPDTDRLSEIALRLQQFELPVMIGG
jgi:pyruvate formate lyase activating enzyme